jgi:hypothetical protein
MFISFRTSSHDLPKPQAVNIIGGFSKPSPENLRHHLSWRLHNDYNMVICTRIFARFLKKALQKDPDSMLSSGGSTFTGDSPS